MLLLNIDYFFKNIKIKVIMIFWGEKMFENLKEKGCICGKEHIFTSLIVAEKGAVERLPLILEERKINRSFIIADKNTYLAAGEKVMGILQGSNRKNIFSAVKILNLMRQTWVLRL